MDNEEYSQTQATLMGLARVVNKMDLAGFLERIESADALGPILDPTLYSGAMDNLSDIRRLAASLKPFKEEIDKQLRRRYEKAARNAPSP